MIRLVLSDMPPSANSLRKNFVKNGKVMSAKTHEYASWREAALWEIKLQKAGQVDGPYSLSIAVQRHWRSKRARDLDNVIKPLSDALVKAGTIKDDSLAERITTQWVDDLGGPAVVMIIQEAVEALAA